MTSCLGGIQLPWSSDSSSSMDDDNAQPQPTLSSPSAPSQQHYKDEEEDRELGYQAANPVLLPAALEQLAAGDALGFSFGGGGFMLPYHLGVVKSLGALGLASSCKVGGTSAGSLAAVVMALSGASEGHLGLDVDEVLSTVRAMMASMREGGVFRRLGPLMRETVRLND